MFEEDLRARAIAAGVAEFHWAEAPEDVALPYAVAIAVSDPRPQHLEGYMGGRTTRVQVDCYAASAKVAKQMAHDLIAALSEPGTEGGTQFGRCQAQGPVDRSQQSGGRTIHQQMIEFAVFHRQL